MGGFGRQEGKRGRYKIMFILMMCINIQRIDVVIRGNDAVFSVIADFIHSMMGLLIFKYEPFCQEVRV